MNRIASVALAALLSTFAFACTADGTGTDALGENDLQQSASTNEIDAVGVPKTGMAAMAPKGFRSDVEAKRVNDVKNALKQPAGPEQTEEDLARLEKATGHKGVAEMTTEEADEKLDTIEKAQGLSGNRVIDVRTNLEVDGVRYTK